LHGRETNWDMSISHSHYTTTLRFRDLLVGWTIARSIADTGLRTMWSLAMRVVTMQAHLHLPYRTQTAQHILMPFRPALILKDTIKTQQWRLLEFNNILSMSPRNAGIHIYWCDELDAMSGSWFFTIQFMITLENLSKLYTDCHVIVVARSMVYTTMDAVWIKFSCLGVMMVSFNQHSIRWSCFYLYSRTNLLYYLLFQLRLCFARPDEFQRKHARLCLLMR